MTNVVAPPSHNPTDEDSLYGVLKIFTEKFLQNNINDMLPAQVIAYDRGSNLAQIQPLINMVDTLNSQIVRGQIMSVPVLQLGGGGFMLNFPIKTGDLGFMKANDRDISLFKQSWGQSIPNTARMHDFSEARNVHIKFR